MHLDDEFVNESEEQNKNTVENGEERADSPDNKDENEFAFYEKGPMNASIIEDENDGEETKARVLEEKGKYLFDFDKYNEQSSTEQSASQTDNRLSVAGMHTFAMVLVGVLVVATVFFAGFGVYKIATGGSGSKAETEMEYDPGSLVIKDAPSSNSSGGNTSNTTSAKQVASKVTPSIVSVIAYTRHSTIEPAAYGSGIIQSADGNIITNSHLIDGAATIKVILSNKEEHTASVIGSDSKSDLAIIKISAKNLTPAEFGNSDKLAVGEDVLSMGNPSDNKFSGTVTRGIIANLEKEVITAQGHMTRVLQIDNAVNASNTGGALVNMYSQVVGVNTAKLVNSEENAYGYAIPINSAKYIIESLIKYGYVKDRVHLGVQVIQVDDTVAKINSLPKGLYIKELEQRSVLYKNNVRQGDVITQINGNDAGDVNAFFKDVAKMKPGDKVKFKIYRKGSSGNGNYFEVTVTLEQDNY